MFDFFKKYDSASGNRTELGRDLADLGDTVPSRVKSSHITSRFP